MAARWGHVLLDLDGTLTDSCEGIIKSLQYALSKYDIQRTDEELMPLVGPPLLDSFKGCFKMSPEMAQEAYDHYRERYGTVGLFENRVYDGIPQVLQRLKDAGLALALATSKVEEYALRIMERFDLTRYFDVIAGGDLSKGKLRKADVVTKALSMLGNPDKHDVVMVGDRLHDVRGAKACGLPCIGVEWGYAPQGELEEEGAVYIAATPQDLCDYLLGGKSA